MAGPMRDTGGSAANYSGLVAPLLLPTWLIIGVLLLGAVLMNNTFRKMALSYSPKKGAK